MTAMTIDPDARENVQRWLTSLRTPGLSKDDMVKIYTEWTEKADYDKDMLAAGFEAPFLTVRYFSENFPKEKRSEVKILDVGAGTGMVARGLRDEGFCHIDALDACIAMLALARKDSLYENYFCDYLSDKPLDCIEPDIYDGLTASACFARNHIPPESLQEIIRVVKPGGVVVIVARAATMTTVSPFKDRLLPLMDTLEKQGKWKNLVAETTGRFFLEDDAIVWKYQVLQSSKQ